MLKKKGLDCLELIHVQLSTAAHAFSSSSLNAMGASTPCIKKKKRASAP